MNFIVLCLSIFTIFSHSLNANDQFQRKWIDFKIEHRKFYKSPLEELKRSSIFRENLVQIEVHNEAFKRGEVSYQKGVTIFADWTQEEFREYLNRSNGFKQLKTEIFNGTDSSDIPDSKDWRYINAVTPVKNEGQLGLSFPFGVTGSIEGQLGIIRRKLISLSEKNLVDCSDSIYSGFKYAQEHGIESEDDYPKTGDNSCKTDESRIVAKLETFTQIAQGSEVSLLEILGNLGPVSVTIDATDGLQLYAEGIFDGDKCSSELVNHVMLAVGYGSENGVDYFILKNSWGTSWGESGYVRLLRNGDNKCGVASWAYFPILKENY